MKLQNKKQPGLLTGHHGVGASLAVGVAALAALGGGVAQAAAATSHGPAAVAPRSLPTPPKTGPLHIEVNIALGVTVSAIDAPTVPVAEAPNGAVYYANGSTVDVVVTTGAPQVAEHAAAKVSALGADATDLYVLTGLKVTDYSRSTGKVIRTWNLSPTQGTPTSAGILAQPTGVYVWTDPATDQSGFQFATINSLVSNSKVIIVDRSAYPGWLDEDENGYVYYESESSHLVRSTAAGARVYSVKVAPVDAPLVLSDGRIVIESEGTKPVWSTWYPDKLIGISANNLPPGFSFVDFANSGAGLIGHNESNSSQVARVQLTHGTLSDAVATGGPIVRVLEGYYPAVVTDVSGHLHLVRID